jgi:hypothetical protein
MTIVGGLDVHGRQITFDYVDIDTGLVRWGQIRRPDPVRGPGLHAPSTLTVVGDRRYHFTVRADPRSSGVMGRQPRAAVVASTSATRVRM